MNNVLYQSVHNRNRYLDGRQETEAVFYLFLEVSLIPLYDNLVVCLPVGGIKLMRT